MKIIGNKIYEICPSCGKMVCLNKFILGSLHICSTDKELTNSHYRQYVKQIYEKQKKWLGQNDPSEKEEI